MKQTFSHVEYIIKLLGKHLPPLVVRALLLFRVQFVAWKLRFSPQLVLKQLYVVEHHRYLTNQHSSKLDIPETVLQTINQELYEAAIYLLRGSLGTRVLDIFRVCDC